MTEPCAADGDSDTSSYARRWRLPLLMVPLVGLLLLVVPTAMVLMPYDDVPHSPDGILVLGGVGQERVELGLELAEAYEVPLVLSSSATWFANELGYRCSLGNALCLQRPFAESTAEEAQHTATFVDERDWDHITVVTSSHHTARARIVFRQCLGEAVSIVGAPRPETLGGEAPAHRWDVTGVKPLERIREVAGIAATVTVIRAC